MDNRKSSLISRGFWSETEPDLARQVERLPEVIQHSKIVTQNEVTMSSDDTLSQNIYRLLMSAILQSSNQEPDKIDQFKYKKIGELTVLPKNNSKTEPLNLMLYYVSSNKSHNQHFFLVDEHQNVVGYARFNHNEKSPHLKSAYANLSFIALDAIESKIRDHYSLGPILVQAVFEHSLKVGCEGRIVLFSANNTGGVYFKYGFIPLKEAIFDKLFYQGEGKIDGETMFLTSSVIDAWKSRSHAHPLLPSSVDEEETLIKGINNLLR